MNEWQNQMLSALAPEDRDPKRIRQFARDNGYTVGTRGRFKQELISAYVTEMTERAAQRVYESDPDAVPF